VECCTEFWGRDLSFKTEAENRPVEKAMHEVPALMTTWHRKKEELG